ncbi:MAG: hypothetical protein HUJ76_03135 [Parasporobacterium sp.]|nr:hypothetical protein [Parasporobacterium sp.]
MADTTLLYRHQFRLSLGKMVFKAAAFIIIFIVAVLSKSLIAWSDVVEQIGAFARGIVILVISGKLRNDVRYEYNYGVAKLESVAVLFSEAIKLGGFIVIGGEIINELFREGEAFSYFNFVLIAFKMINIAADITLILQQKSLSGRYGDTFVARRAMEDHKEDLFFDGGIFLALILSLILRNTKFHRYVVPGLMFVLLIVFTIEIIRGIKHNIKILSERTLPEDKQMHIVAAMARLADRYEDFDKVNSCSMGNYEKIDVHLTFAEDATYRHIEDFRNDLEAEIRKNLPDAEVNIIFGEDETL